MNENLSVGSIVSALKNVASGLTGDQRELTMDFSSVERIDSRAVQALEQLAHKADEKKLKVVLRGVNIHVYKALKLVRLTRRFAFAD